MKKYSLLIIFIFLQNIATAQVSDYAKMVVYNLSSDTMKGRGYVEEGEKIAANYVKEVFDKLGLKSFEDDYFQTFSVSVNTFQHSVLLKINGKQLEAGSAFLVDSGSPKISGTFEVVNVSAEDLLSDELMSLKLQKAPDKFLIIEAINDKNFSKNELNRIQSVINFLKYHENNPAVGTIILTDDKLTWSASTIEYTKPSFTILADSVSEEIERIELDLQNKFYENYQTQNVIGYIEGENQDSTVVFTAHYDHLGMMGPNVVFNGANDNASGVAMLLSLARYYAQNKPAFNMVFIAFGAEELGLLGSDYFTEHPLFDLSKIKFLINFDIVGTGENGIQVVNGSVYKDQFEILSQLNERHQLLPQVITRGAACISDHCMFDKQNVPNFYIYTLGGISAYHDIYDRRETLPLTEFADYFQLVIRFVERL